MLRTKLNRPTNTADHLERPHLVELLEKNRHLPLILVSAPAGYGKSILISQWLEQKNNFGWLSIDESMNDAPTFVKYFTEGLSIACAAAASGLKNWEQENYFLKWEAIIDKVINKLNELKEPVRLILDDYHLIRNQEIHELISAIINEDITNFHLVIITRRDPPLRLRGLRLYHKMFELRAHDLKFDENDIRKLLAKERIVDFSDEELSDLYEQSEGWVLAIRIMLAARSFQMLEGNKGKSLTLSNDLDDLLVHISDKLDPKFFRQLQICSLCDQFSEELIDSVFSHAFQDSDSAAILLKKLRDLNFFLIPTSEDGTWYRFHHLIRDILKRQLEKNEPETINQLYIKISKWFSGKNIVDEAIRYAIKGNDYALASRQIISHRESILEKGQWWVLQRWLNNIPRQIRNTNIDLLLMELLVCEETWRIRDFSSILEILESVGIENSNDKNISLYLFHLGYFLTYINPNPKKATESLERSKALFHDDSYMFGGRRELILASSRQMLGLTALALQSLEEIRQKFDPSSQLHIRAIHGKVLVHLHSGNLEAANSDSNKLLFLVQDSELQYAKGWGSYFLGNIAFQWYNEYEAIHSLKGVLAFEGLFNLRVYFDALAGLALISSLQEDQEATALFLEQMCQLALKLKDTNFQNYCRSVQARVNWHAGQGDKELGWAEADWVKQHPSSYLFLIDVPELTKLRIVVSHGSRAQVEEAVAMLKEVEAMLESVHNHYQQIDLVLLRAMGYLRLGEKERAAKYLTEALILADKNDMVRPVVEVNRVMPDLFNLIAKTDAHNRLLSRIGIDSSSQKFLSVPTFKDNRLTTREQKVVELIAKGLQNKEVADQLHISTVTVKSHLTNIFKKLGVSNRTSMLRIIQDQRPLFKIQ
ncbi:LuxR C-terminal-related transcriptional regulator [Flavihumibacter fluvii]|uniref:LuxR C-terminal-related transcriptional regulator n=1 Tax=Flavihumibacter fluvii TaxID=2838157 RepID=UPI001BDF3D68|nr:LuxR C-terminal-related transcriptional regulator [Flavihumibacter fluvii]ULQ51170.1 LuxR C-terminal-related transcriptional regulator [Flavihumibacter fluvii]